jgi:hypothetical protein
MKGGGTSTDVTIDDHTSVPWAQNLAGPFAYSSGGLVWGTGWSCTKVLMGLGDGTSCDPTPAANTGGVDAGVDIYGGGTFLLGATTECCSGKCEP